MNNRINIGAARYFLNDSKDYLYRYQNLKENQSGLSERSKLLIDILFSIECSLKALVFLKSNQSEKETYGIIKKCGHKLKCLMSRIDAEHIPDYLSTTVTVLSEFEICSRYTIEANIDFRNDHGVMDEFYYSTIANPQWLDEQYGKADKVYNYVNSLVIQPHEIISFSDIDIEEKIEQSNRLRSIRGN